MIIVGTMMIIIMEDMIATAGRATVEKMTIKLSHKEMLVVMEFFQLIYFVRM